MEKLSIQTFIQRAVFIGQMLFKSLMPPLYSLEKLEKFCRKKLARNPTAYLPRSFLAHLYKDYVKYPEARKEFEILLQQGYKDDSLFKSLGEVCYRSKDYEAAIKCLEKVAGSFSHDKHFNTHLGMSYMYTKSYEKAVSHLIQAAGSTLRKGFLSQLKEGPLPEINEGYLYENVGYCFFNLGQFERSAESYRKALSFDPNGPRSLKIRGDTASAHIHLANRLLQEGKREEAVAQFHLALEIQPEASIVEAISQTLRDLGEEVPISKSRLH